MGSVGSRIAAMVTLLACAVSFTAPAPAFGAGAPANGEVGREAREAPPAPPPGRAPAEAIREQAEPPLPAPAPGLAEGAPTRPPILDWLEAQGVALTPLGEEGGLAAWLGEAPGGRMQTFYLTPDGRHIVAGLMFGLGGTNVTAAQLATMRGRIEAERRRIQERDRLVADAQRALEGGFERALAPVPERREGAGPSAGPTPTGPTRAAGAEPERREALMRAAAATAWFSIGRADVPVVYMVADPQCPHCHAVWAQLKPRVEAGEIAVRIILVAALPGSEARAISIMARPEPGRVWLAGEGSTPAPVAPPPPAGSRQDLVARQLLRVNLDFAREAGIRGTPWLAYVGDDGALHTVEGAVDMGVFLRHATRREGSAR